CQFALYCCHKPQSAQTFPGQHSGVLPLSFQRFPDSGFAGDCAATFLVTPSFFRAKIDSLQQGKCNKQVLETFKMRFLELILVARPVIQVTVHASVTNTSNQTSCRHNNKTLFNL